MSFISYAQNFEDVMLWRALKHVSKGFYIDVGANDPTVDSVTRSFYDRGWHGINIEPMRQYHVRLAIERPSDINLAVAVGDTDGELRFFDVADTGLSTMEEAIASAHVAAGRTVTERPVRIMRLADICRSHVRGDIHFLKIDVEGFEAQALRGMDFTQWRPWILVIEATRPQSQVRSNEAWSDLVLGAGYQLAYFDGLNDYYVAQEHAELMAAFAVAPNFFDDFVLRSGHFYSYPLADMEHRIWQFSVKFDAAEKAAHEAREWGQAASARAEHVEQLLAQTRDEADRAHQATASASAQVDLLNQRTAQVESELATALARAMQAEWLHAQAHAALLATQSSLSWKVTRPLRQIKRLMNHAHPVRAVARVVARPVRRFLVRAARWAVRQDQFAGVSARVYRRLPALEARLEPMLRRLSPPAPVVAAVETSAESPVATAIGLPLPTTPATVHMAALRLHQAIVQHTPPSPRLAAGVPDSAASPSNIPESHAHRS